MALPVAAVLGFVSAVAVTGCARSPVKPSSGSELENAPGTTTLTSAISRSGVFGLFGGKNDRGARTAPDRRFGATNPLDALLAGDRPLANNGLCPPEMASIDDRYCVDRYEGSLVEVLPSGDERPWPFTQPMDGTGIALRAVSVPGVKPQGYISGKQAAEACGRSGKRLCKPAEWKQACRGPARTQFGYGQERVDGTCNDHGRSPVRARIAEEPGSGWSWTWDRMNDPKLNAFEGTLADTGSHPACTNGYGVYDMVGNLHEWVDDADGTFLGGYYQDTHINGDGCGYRTDAHSFTYHDYSTGFRCCADVAQ